MAPAYKFQYFNGRARGEIPRLMFAEAGVPFEDIRVEQADWPKVKPTTPFGTMPILFIDGEWLAQSGAICRYLASKFNLLGDSDKSAAFCDMIWESVGEVYFKCTEYFFEPDEEKKNKGIADTMENKVIPLLQKLEAKHSKDPERGNKDHLIGGKLTLADISVAYYLDELHGINPKLYDGIPALAHVVKTTLARPNIKKWMETRPKTPF